MRKLTLSDHSDVLTVVNNAKAARANAIFAQVRRRGDSFYLKSLEPPNTDAGKHAKQQLDALAAQLQTTMQSAKQTLAGVPENAGTGELYLMQKPLPSPWVGWLVDDAKDDVRALAAFEHQIVGGLRHLLHPRQVHAKTGSDPGDRFKDALTEELTVEVLAVIPSENEVARLLDGWEAEVDAPDSLTWVRGRASTVGG